MAPHCFTPFGSPHCGPGKMRGLVTLSNSEYVLPLASPHCPLLGFSIQTGGLRLSFLVMPSHPQLGCGFPPLKLAWELLKPVHAPLQLHLWGSPRTLRPTPLPVGHPGCAACRVPVPGLVPAYQPGAGSASCCVTDGAHGHTGSWVVIQDDLCSNQQNKICDAILWGKFLRFLKVY